MEGMSLPQCEGPSYPGQISVRDKLLRERKRLEDKIADIDRALELYSNNPDIEELTNLLGRVI